MVSMWGSRWRDPWPETWVSHYVVFWAGQLNLTMCLSTQEYGRVPENCQGEIFNLVSHPGGSSDTPSHFILRKPQY